MLETSSTSRRGESEELGKCSAGVVAVAVVLSFPVTTWSVAMAPLLASACCLPLAPLKNNPQPSVTNEILSQRQRYAKPSSQQLPLACHSKSARSWSFSVERQQSGVGAVIKIPCLPISIHAWVMAFAVQVVMLTNEIYASITVYTSLAITLVAFTAQCIPFRT